MNLWLKCLTKRYPGVKVLEEISCEIEPGTIMALLGSNGAGKTTLLRCLATLSSPDSGDIVIDGDILRRGRLDLRRRMMFLPDFRHLKMLRFWKLVTKALCILVLLQAACYITSICLLAESISSGWKHATWAWAVVFMGAGELFRHATLRFMIFAARRARADFAA